MGKFRADLVQYQALILLIMSSLLDFCTLSPRHLNALFWCQKLQLQFLLHFSSGSLLLLSVPQCINQLSLRHKASVSFTLAQWPAIPVSCLSFRQDSAEGKLMESRREFGAGAEDTNFLKKKNSKSDENRGQMRLSYVLLQEKQKFFKKSFTKIKSLGIMCAIAGA